MLSGWFGTDGKIPETTTPPSVPERPPTTLYCELLNTPWKSPLPGLMQPTTGPLSVSRWKVPTTNCVAPLPHSPNAHVP